MIRKPFFFLAILIPCLVCIACTRVHPDLREAERIMETKPDSALLVLDRIPAGQLKTDSDKALYGLLLFQAFEKNNKPLGPDSVISFSIHYYEETEDKPRLATCYFYKARLYKRAQQFEKAMTLYLCALDKTTTNNNLLLAQIYSDMGDICFMQRDYNASRDKYQLAMDYLTASGKMIDVGYRLLDIGRTYYALKDFKTAEKYFKKALITTNDSILIGSSLQEIGVNHYWAKQYDSAQHYLLGSLNFPYIGFNYAIRCYTIADSYYNIEKFDSAFKYATISLKYPANFFTKRECYRILANTEYLRGNHKEMAVYMTHFQACSDSVRRIESQTKSTVLETLHTKTLEAKSANSNTMLISLLMALTTALSAWGLYALYGRNRHKRLQLENVRRQLHSRQELVSQGAVERIERARQLQSPRRRGATPAERERLDRELYHQTLHLSEWGVFCCEMNHTFNHVVDKLQGCLPAITRKEITWCCLELLGVPPAERALLLETTPQGLYKLKQRLAQRLGLDSTRGLDAFLRELVSHEA